MTMKEKSSLIDGSPSERTAINKSIISENSASRDAIWIFPRRYLVAFMAFLGFFNVYALRVNLSVAVVAMTNPSIILTDNEILRQIPAEFDWNPAVKGLILSSFFYGYIMTQLPAGYIAAKSGGRKLFGIGVGVASLLTILTPMFAKTSIYLLLAARVVEGLFEGLAYPAIHAVWSRWAPPLERTKLSTFAFSGSYFGTVFALPVSGMLAQKFGWPSIFLVFGVMGLVWSICWYTIVADTPATDKYITEQELEYIRSTLGSAANNVKVHMSVPWHKIFTSLPVWAIIIAHFSENWGFYTLLTELPTYLHDVFGYELELGGSISALPYLVMGVMVQLGGLLADYIRSQGYMTTGATRKMCNTVGFLMQAIFLVITASATNPTVVIITLSAAIGFGGLAWSGFGVNHLDIAPAHASILMGVSNTFATLPGMISPIMTGFLVTSKSREEWQIMFYIAAVIYAVGALFYALFASGDEQQWARLDTGLLRDDDSTTEECD